MKKPNLAYYVTKINEIVKLTEETGETMHANYDLVSNAIEEGKESELTSEQLDEVYENFANGTNIYKEQFAFLKTLKPTPMLMGNHKTFEKAYGNYVEACLEMVKSVHEKVDVELFRTSEKAQEEASVVISKCIGRITKVIMG